MASACCPHWPCPCDQLLKSVHFREETRHEQEEHADTISLPTNMNIALLKEQYNSIREKQKRETRVICFAKGKKKFVCVFFNSERIPDFLLLECATFCRVTAGAN